MVKHVSICLVVLLASCVLAGAAPRLSSAEVIRIADTEATRQHYDLGAYQRPPGYNYAFKEDLWRVFYHRKHIKGTGTFGKDFTVTIPDKTKKATLVPRS
jgi:hypothetical protein